MSNENQMIRKDAKNCFVESLNDRFACGKIHWNFAAYDLSKPEGSRQTSNVRIYINVDEFLELCRKLECGELRYLLQTRKKSEDKSPIYQSLGGTSAEKLAKIGKSRKDKLSLSRVMQLLPGSKSDFLLVADSGPGQVTDKGLIAPKFGTRPENHVAVSMTFETFSELMLVTKAHYQAWLAAQYIAAANSGEAGQNKITEETEERYLCPFP